MHLRDIQHAVHENAKAHGWWDKERTPGELLMLVVSEAAEALEDVRVNKFSTTLRESDGKPEGYATELADIVIRVLDMAAAADIDLEAEILRKHEFNKTRPYHHGDKAL